MKPYRTTIGWLCVAGALMAPVVLSALVAQDQRPTATAENPVATAPPLVQGRYMVMMGGCNDCHTPGFTEASGKTPESDWLTGTSTGWYGPWGTTYPANLRLLVTAMSEDAWVKFARDLKTQPPMPWWVLHQMRESDLRDLYRLIKTLGPKGGPVPAPLPPKEKPQPPYVAFVFPSAS